MDSISCELNLYLDSERIKKVDKKYYFVYDNMEEKELNILNEYGNYRIKRGNEYMFDIIIKEKLKYPENLLSYLNKLFN